METGRDEKEIPENLEEARIKLDILKKEYAASVRNKENEILIEESKNLSNEELLKKLKTLYCSKDYVKIARYLSVIFILKNYTIITDYRTDTIKAYNEESKYFRDIGEEMIKMFLTKEIEEHNNRNTCEEILHMLRTQTYIHDEEMKKKQPLNLIPLKNGIYNITTGELLNHSPEYLFDYQIPVNYNPECECPKIDKFFNEIVEPKDISLLYDIFAFSIYRSNFLEKFFILTGEGQNGKSRFIGLIQAFIGLENYSSISLQQLTEDKFSVARTYKKLVNIGADIGGMPIKDTSILKSASASDPISGQFKFGQIFDFTPTATLIYSANKPPVFYDDSIGIYRRAELIHFPNIFGNDEDIKENPKVKKANPNILEEISTPEELSGLMNKAIKHLKNIFDTGQLSVVKSAQTLKKNYQLYSNNVQAFVEQCCEETLYINGNKENNIPSEGFITSSQLYEYYTTFCSINNLGCRTKDVFIKMLKNISSLNIEVGQQDYIDGVRHKSVRGICINNAFKKEYLLYNEEKSQIEKNKGGATTDGIVVATTSDTPDTHDTPDTPYAYLKFIPRNIKNQKEIERGVSGVQGVSGVSGSIYSSTNIPFSILADSVTKWEGDNDHWVKLLGNPESVSKLAVFGFDGGSDVGVVDVKSDNHIGSGLSSDKSYSSSMFKFRQIKEYILNELSEHKEMDIEQLFSDLSGKNCSREDFDVILADFLSGGVLFESRAGFVRRLY